MSFEVKNNIGPKEGGPMFPYEISFPDTAADDSIKEIIKGHLEHLDQFYNRIIFCHVFVRRPHNHREKSFYHIHILLKIPGKIINVNREPEVDYNHTEVAVALHDAFDTAIRQLEDYVKVRRAPPRESNGSSHGVIKSFDPNTGYGFIETYEGREIYFHENSLLSGNLRELRSGVEVRFHEEVGNEGTQASSFAVVGKS